MLTFAARYLRGEYSDFRERKNNLKFFFES